MLNAHNKPLILAVPSTHPLAQKGCQTVSIARLADEPFILYRRPSGPGLYDAIVSACREAGFSPNIVQVAQHLTATLSLVAAGFGLSLVPASMRSLAQNTVYFLALDEKSLTAPIDLVTRSDDPNPALVRFRAFITSLHSAITR